MFIVFKHASSDVINNIGNKYKRLIRINSKKRINYNIDKYHYKLCKNQLQPNFLIFRRPGRQHKPKPLQPGQWMKPTWGTK